MPSRLSSQQLQRYCAVFLLTIMLIPPPFPALGQSEYQPIENAGCQLESGGESTVLAVASPQTLHLADGRSIRLAEILIPTARSGSGFDPSSAATAYLRSVALARKVQVKFGGSRRDRYGATVAHVYVMGDSPVWLQEVLVRSGLAQAFPQPDNHACSKELASFESKAREEKRGHWGDALFQVLSAHDTRALMNLIQTYQIVEGKVAYVTHAGSRTTIHFGEGTRYDFSVTVESAAQKTLTENPDKWQGELIQVRGWVEQKRGPTISVIQPEQMHVLRQLPEVKSTPSEKPR